MRIESNRKSYQRIAQLYPPIPPPQKKTINGHVKKIIMPESQLTYRCGILSEIVVIQISLDSAATALQFTFKACGTDMR